MLKVLRKTLFRGTATLGLCSRGERLVPLWTQQEKVGIYSQRGRWKMSADGKLLSGWGHCLLNWHNRILPEGRQLPGGWKPVRDSTKIDLTGLWLNLSLWGHAQGQGLLETILRTAWLEFGQRASLSPPTRVWPDSPHSWPHGSPVPSHPKASLLLLRCEMLLYPNICNTPGSVYWGRLTSYGKTLWWVGDRHSNINSSPILLTSTLAWEVNKVSLRMVTRREASGCSLCQLGLHISYLLSFIPSLSPLSLPTRIPGLALPNKISACNYLPQALFSREFGLRQLASWFPQETGVQSILCLKTFFLSKNIRWSRIK